MIDYAGIFKILVEDEGYELLSEYTGSMKKVKLKCKKGHEYKVTPNHFKKGRRCPVCAGCCPIQAEKVFKELIESEKYKLLSEYKNTKTKVRLKCNKGHEYTVKPNDFKNNHRCPKCAGLCPIQAKEQFFELLTKEKYILISEYENTQTKVKIRCNKGHEYKIKPNDFKNGSICSECLIIQTGKEFKELVESVGYKSLSEYKNSRTKVKIRCNKDHEYKVTPSSFKRGNRCPICSGLCPEQAKEEFKELLEKEGYILISEYVNTKTKVEIKCPEGHEWDVLPSNFKYQYARCPHCEGSTGQRLLQSMLESYDLGKVIYNDREALGGLELDIYYPELNIGIEYQGNYWHSLPKMVENDKRKKLLCKEKGIKLIEVWDDDFMKDQEKELYKILGVINV